MKRQRLVVLLIGVCGLGGWASGAFADPVAPATADTAPAGGDSAEMVVAAPAARAAESLSPCQQAIRALLEREAGQLAALEARVAGAVVEADLLALQREIERVKQETELQVMRTQAEFARREGRPEQAAQIEAALAEMAAPRPAAAPGERSGDTPRGDAAQR